VRTLSAQATSYCGIISPGNGHGIIAVGLKDVGYPPMPEIITYEEEIRSEVEKRLGSRLSLLQPVVGTVFPNFSLLLSAAHTFRVWHPRGPDKTAVWSWVYVDKMAPPEVKEAYRLSSLRAFSPGGTFEQDDMDNWQECTQTCRGVVSRRYQLNYQMGLGHERFNQDLTVWESDYRISKNNHRNFYRRWAQLMAAKSWAEIKG
jgi:hypothetical protein